MTCSKTTQDVKVNLNNARLTVLKLLHKRVDNCKDAIFQLHTRSYVDLIIFQGNICHEK